MKTKNTYNGDLRFFCANIKMLRNIKKISQEALAHDIFLARSTYSDYETGKKIPDLQTIDALSAYYDIEFDLLINHDLSRDFPNSIYSKAASNKNDELTALLNDYQSLSSSSKILIIERVEALLEHEALTCGHSYQHSY